MCFLTLLSIDYKLFLRVHNNSLCGRMNPKLQFVLLVSREVGICDKHLFRAFRMHCALFGSMFCVSKEGQGFEVLRDLLHFQ